MNTFEYIVKKYNLASYWKDKLIEIPDTNRETLAKIFAELGFNRGAEIGVERGLYSEVLCKANPDLHLSAIDAWTAYEGYRDHETQEAMDKIHEEAIERLSPYNGEVIKAFSLQAAAAFDDNSLDFVYIDANHEFQNVVNDIAVWQKKVRVGGIVAGHDYIQRRVQHDNQEYLMHVIPAVNGYVAAYNIRPLFILGSKEKIEGQLRDGVRSWFYVKPEPRSIKPGWKPTP